MILVYRYMAILLCSVGFGLAQAQDVLTVISNRVGVGTTSPTTKLEVVGSADAIIKARNTNASTGTDRFMFQLADPSASKIRFSISNAVGTWSFDTTGNQFQINKVGTAVNEFRVESNGDMVALGRSFATQHINTSTREAKTDFVPVDEIAVLEQLASLPMSSWRYKSEKPARRHLGPVAEDFQQAFGLSDGKHISTIDASGVALTAIKGLNRLLQSKNVEISKLQQANVELRKANKELDERLARLESLMLNRNEEVANR